MVTAKKVRLMLLMPAIIAIAILSGCLDKTPKTNTPQTSDKIQTL